LLEITHSGDQLLYWAILYFGMCCHHSHSVNCILSPVQFKIYGPHYFNWLLDLRQCPYLNLMPHST